MLPTQPRLSELEVGRKDMAQWNELMEGLPKPFAEPAQKRERDEPKEEEPSRATRAPKTTQGEKGGKGRGNQPKVTRDTSERTERTEKRGDDRLPQGSEEHRPDVDNGRHPPGGSTSALSSRQCIHPLHGDLSSPGHLASVVRPRTVLEREEGEGLLLGCLLKQIELRIEKLGTDEELRKVAKDSKLLSEADCFNYLEYDAKAKNYQVKEGRLAIPRKEALQLVRELQEFILIPRVVHRFHASRKHTAEVTAAALPFMLEISNRGEAAQNAYSLFDRLTHSGIMHLVAGNFRRDKIQRSSLVQALAKTVR